MTLVYQTTCSISNAFGLRLKNIRTNRLWICAAMCLGWIGAVPLRAQSAVQFDGAQVAAGSGYSSPLGTTADANNNFYVVDTGNSRVVLLPVAGEQADWIAAGTQIAGVALKSPEAAAVDGSGNVYVADTGNNRIVERAASGATSVVACCSSLSPATIHPVGIAADAAGDLWIADSLNRRIVKISSQGVQSVLPCCLNLQPANIVPAGVAVDGAGNLYIADAGNNRVVEITSDGAQATVMGASTLIAGVPLNNPLGVAVDPSGNLYVADTGNGRAVERTTAGMSSVVGSGFTQPSGVAVDANGNVEIADTGNNRAVQVETQAVQFGFVNVCPAGQNTPTPCSRILRLNYSFTGPVTLGAPVAVLSGKPNLDYAVAAGGTCVQGQAYSAGDSCTLAVQFAPRQGGMRLGAVEMTDSTGAIQSTVLTSGTGGASQADLDAGQSIQLSCCAPLNPSTLQSVNAIVVGGSDTIYFADTGNNRVVKLDASGKASTVGNGLNGPAGIAIDGAGNLFVTTLGNGNAIVEITPAGMQRTIPCCAGLSPNSLNRAFSVAVDSYDNLYVGDFGNNRVVRLSAAGKISEFVSSTDVLDGQTLYAPSTSVVDAKGNVYIADYSRGRVLQLSPSGQVLRVVSGLPGGPDTVAIDGAGDWYTTLPMYAVCATCAQGYILENAPSGQGLALLNGDNPTGIAVDGSGNIFYTGGPSNLVGELKRTAAQAVQFATTPIGLSSTDSPKHVLIQNTGTQPLNLSGLAVTTNFALGSGSGDCIVLLFEGIE